MRKLHLVVIDPQNSFCKEVPADQQQVLHDGELCVPGAWDDMVRLAAMVDRIGDKLVDVHVTLDSHQLLHIAHPVFFKDDAGNQPGPFTIMTAKAGKIEGSDGKTYTTMLPSLHTKVLKYLEALESSGRYPHCIWPPHCLIGSPGHSVVAPLMDSLLKWSQRRYATINFVTKGSNPYTEHFGCVRAEVPDANDPGTQLNTDFLRVLNDADEILISGEALSHCVCHSFKDMANEFADDSFIKKCVLLTNASSPVPGFETQANDFISEMTGRGMKLSTTIDYLS